jgi:hypothetical protein
LVGQSEFFKSRLDSGSGMEAVDFNNIDPAVMDAYIRYVYVGYLDDNAVGLIDDLFKFAQNYDLRELKVSI